MVGQEPIVTALRNALEEERIAQAYLFSGIRGVGKTSVARILAKALNCEQGPTADPCNSCVSCTEITESSGTNLDVHEIDAATHSKVEQVRELTEGLRYGPARDRYKVVILDEIHRLSRQAFDALLKIVEEPPPHLVFIFATTESEAVPVTILSRCQEFRFRRVPSPQLATHLKRLSGEESIEASDKALRLIARAGDGSVRDAVALLDQLATFGSGTISDEAASRLLGGVDHALFLRLLGAMLSGAAAEVSEVVRRVEEEGWDPRHVYGEFLGYARDALHLSMGGDATGVDLPDEEAERLQRVAKKGGYENLLRLLHMLLQSENNVRRSEFGSLALEICWLRGAELPKLVDVEAVLGGREPSSAQKVPAAPGESSARRESEPPPRKEPAPREEPPAAEPPPKKLPESTPEDAPEEKEPEDEDGRLFTPAARLGPPESEPPAPTPEPGPEPPMEAPPPVDPEPAPPVENETEGGRETIPAGSNDLIARFLDEVSRRKLPLAAHLREAQRLAFQEKTLKIYAQPDDPWLNRATLSKETNRLPLEAALEATFGSGSGWRVTEAEAAAPAPTAEADEPETDELASDPRVQKVLDIFGGRIEADDERDRTVEGEPR